MLRAVLRYAFILMAFCLAGVSAAKANTVTYDINYGSTIGSNVTGSGYFTVSYTPGSTAATITGFYFKDTIKVGNSNSIFTYGLADLLTSTVGMVNGQITELDILTKMLLGTNGAFGKADLALLLNSKLDSTAGTSLADYSFGNGALTIAPTPEPSSLLLLGTGLVGAFGMARRKLRA